MTDIKDLLAPFRVERQVQPAPAPDPLTSVSSPDLPQRRNHFSGCDEFDMAFRVSSIAYLDTTGSVSIRGLTQSQFPSFACFLTRADVDKVIGSLIEARDRAFPDGVKAFEWYEE